MYEIAVRDTNLFPAVRETGEKYEIAIRNNDLLPAVCAGDLLPSEVADGLVIDMEIKPVEIKRPWYKKKSKIETLSFGYLEYVENKMVVYRMIPHAGVSENNRKLWNAIYRMYEMYGGVMSRVEVITGKKKIRFREKDMFWFDIIFRQENGEKKIEFYVSTSTFQSDKLKRKIENMMKVTLKEATIGDLCIPEEDTVVQDLRYLRHDIFSMDTSVHDKQSSVASILNTVEDLQFDGDMARMSVCNEVEDRKKWIHNATYAMDKLKNGKVPQRSNGSFKSALPFVKTGITSVVNEVYGLMQEILHAVGSIMYKDQEKVVDKKLLEGHTLEDEINATRIKPESMEKMNKPVFKTHIRVASHSKDRLTKDSMGDTLALAVSDMGGDNEMTTKKVKNHKKVINEMNNLKLEGTTRNRVDVNLMSTDELNKIVMQMPKKDLQMKYVDEISTRKTVETVIPYSLQKPENLLLGYAQLKDRKIPIGLDASKKDDFNCTYTVIGKQGSGKDTFIQNFVYEGALKHKTSFIVMDWICQSGHKGMADGIRDLLPEEKVIDLDLSNEEWVIPMDMTEVVEKLGRKGGSRFALEMVDLLGLEELPRSQKYLTEAAKASKGSLLNIKRIIEEEDFRIGIIEQLKDEGDLRAAMDLVRWGTNDDLGGKCDAILSRLNMFFGDDTLRDIFSQPPIVEMNFEQWMREGKTIIVRMPKRVLGDASKVLAHWVTLKVFMTRMLMSEEDKENHNCFLIFNEPEQVESKGLAGLMGRIATEGRKERLGSIYAFHHWDKLPNYLQKNLIGGGVNRFLFASSYRKTFEVVKEYLEPNFTVDEALQTPKYHAIALLNTEEPVPAFLVRTTPPVPEEDRYNNEHLTIKHAIMYGRSWDDLQMM